MFVIVNMKKFKFTSKKSLKIDLKIHILDNLYLIQEKNIKGHLIFNL